MKNIYHANAKHKRVEQALLISDKIDFKTKSMNKGSDQHFIIMNRLIHHQDIIIKNVSIPINRALKYMPSKITD